MTDSEVEIEAGTQTPEIGFYYHYKHTPDSVYNYAYEVVGVGTNTENSDEHFVIYRPLYQSLSAHHAGDFWIRPLAMFMENVTKGGKTFPRFAKVTDPEIITKLEEIKREMYKSI